MADEYIRREDAIDYIEGFVTMNQYYHPYSKRTTIPIAEAIARINETPSADVQPVVHGEWEENSRTSISERHRQIHYSIYKCSRCNHANGRFKSNFCPSCGADMRGGT